MATNEEIRTLLRTLHICHDPAISIMNLEYLRELLVINGELTRDEAWGLSPYRAVDYLPQAPKGHLRTFWDYFLNYRSPKLPKKKIPYSLPVLNQILSYVPNYKVLREKEIWALKVDRLLGKRIYNPRKSIKFNPEELWQHIRGRPSEFRETNYFLYFTIASSEIDPHYFEEAIRSLIHQGRFHKKPIGFSYNTYYETGLYMAIKDLNEPLLEHLLEIAKKYGYIEMAAISNEKWLYLLYRNLVFWPSSPDREKTYRVFERLLKEGLQPVCRFPKTLKLAKESLETFKKYPNVKIEAFTHQILLM